MKKLIFNSATLAVALTLASCSSYVPTRYYLIDTEPTVEREEEPLPLTIEIGDIRAPSRYQDQIFYRAGDYEVGFYENSQWVEPPAEMVRSAIENALGASNLFQKIEPPGGAATPDILLQGRIERFDQVVTGSGNFADFELTLVLLTGSRGEEIWRYRVKKRVKQAGKGRFPAAMSSAVSAAVREALTAMEKSNALNKLAAEKEQGQGADSPQSRESTTPGPA